MDNDYPSDEFLKSIEEWPHSIPWPELLDSIKGHWKYADMMWHEKGGVYYISTGGWSGNEGIIGAMQSNFLFWSMCWVASRTGGHYLFDVNKYDKYA